jgi:RNA polymerase sigma-70 factor (ECF subfamily)
MTDAAKLRPRIDSKQPLVPQGQAELPRRKRRRDGLRMSRTQPRVRFKRLPSFLHKFHFISFLVSVSRLALPSAFVFCIVNARPFVLVYLHDDFDPNGTNVAALYELASPRTGFAAVNPPLDSSADPALVRAAQRGDRSAYGILYSRYARMVHGILLARVASHQVEDLVQDVFLQALPKLPALRDPHYFPGWLAAIARNRASDFHRNSKSDVSLDDDLNAEKSPPLAKLATPENSHSSAEARAALDAIRSLPEAYREPLMLRLVEGMSGPEIAARTGLTHGSVRVNLSRGMQLLRELLNRKVSPASGGDL